MFNLWVASGPPNACPECYLKNGYKHFGISIFSFVLSVFTTLVCKKEQISKIVKYAIFI